jgi:tRNA-5-taurinomethyluridine 2-sulfurtransferase
MLTEIHVLPPSLATLAAEIAKHASGAPRYLALIDVGRRLTQMPDELQTADTRVPGCTSVVHVHVALEPVGGEPVLRLCGAADAQVARGLVALLVLGLDGALARDVLSLAVADVANAAQLELPSAPSRAVGFASVLATIQARVRSLLSDAEQNGVEDVELLSKATPTTEDAIIPNAVSAAVRWSSVQPHDVAVLLSGGVDSSVAMRLVMESGARPHPYYLKIWLEDELAHLGQCPWEEDIACATAVCDQARVSLQALPFQRDYWDRVVSYTIAEARAGRTPNPDVMCNSKIKFGAFYDQIGRHYPSVATGHYARTDVNDATGLTRLLLSEDGLKDQTYFLAHLSQEQLAHAQFPIGHYRKDEVRELACKYNLPNRSRKDSQGICFLGKLKFDSFLQYHLGIESGSLVEYETGITVGTHRGFWFYTLGQRKGLGLSGGPWYVASKDPSENIVYVSRRYDDPEKARDKFDFEAVSWISGMWPKGLSEDGCSTDLLVKTRHGPVVTRCIVCRTSEWTGRVQLYARDKGLAPGQFAAFYKDDVCLGSGIISNDGALLLAHQMNGEVTQKQLQACDRTHSAF